MPFFSRHDGDLVRGEPAMRRIMPYLMRSRNESVVYNDSTFLIEQTRHWLKAYNRTHDAHATMFHLLAYAVAQMLHERPELNRFVSGGRLYQRRGVQLSFVVKRELKDNGLSTTVKVEMPSREPFAAYVARVVAMIREAQDSERHVDKETAMVMMLPGPMVRGLIAVARWLDHWNLYPRFMTDNDPMYASMFLANLGSVGISDAYHHLYEYGTVSLFGAVSAPNYAPVVEDREVVARQVLKVRWTFDERIHDAFYAARSLNLIRQIVEAPYRYLGDPELDPQYRG